MRIPYNPEEYITYSKHTTCDYHKRNPFDKSYPGCACSSTYGLRKRTPEEMDELREKMKKSWPENIIDLLYEAQRFK